MNATTQGPRDHRIVISRFVDVCRADERIVAALLCGSFARWEADEYSDLDLCLITADEAPTRTSRLSERPSSAGLVRCCSSKDFGHEGIVFFILSDGTEGELLFGRESRLDEIHVGPYQTLLDKKGVPVGVELPLGEPDRGEQIEAARRALFWFWHELSHFIAPGPDR